MCCAEFIVKYTLFIANVVFSLAGIALIALGVVVLYQIESLLELVPINLNLIPIVIIVVGSIVFLIAFFGCCGAIRESRCLLVMYSICMAILAAIKIWLAVVLFRSLDNIQNTLEGWLSSAFNNNTLREAYFALELAFKCCGTTGPEAYAVIGIPILPPTCCANPTDTNYCLREDAFVGCFNIIGDYFESFGGAIGGVVITVIIVELVAMLFGMFFTHAITNKRRAY